MLLRSGLAFFVLACGAAVTALPAQQAPDSSALAGAPAIQDSTPTAVPAASPKPLLGPRVSNGFQTVQPQLAPSNGFERSSRMAAAGSSTITISTLTLVLIVIIVVLLVT